MVGASFYAGSVTISGSHSGARVITNVYALDQGVMRRKYWSAIDLALSGGSGIKDKEHSADV